MFRECVCQWGGGDRRACEGLRVHDTCTLLTLVFTCLFAPQICLPAGRIEWYQNSGAQPPVWTKQSVTAVGGYPMAVYSRDMIQDGTDDVVRSSALAR